MEEVDRMDLTKRLEEKRKEIDLIDRKLLSLFNHRLRTALEIGKVKKKMGKKIYDPGREKRVLERLHAKNRGPLTEKDLEKIFRTMIRASRRFQKGFNSRIPR
jgi:monofunctional chorismate mutase